MPPRIYFQGKTKEEPDVSTWGVSARRRIKRQREKEAAAAAAAAGESVVAETRSKRRRKRSGSHTKTKSTSPTWVSIEVSSLLGEAHAEMVFGDEEKAICILGEVVKRCPEADEAYSTLSGIYESRWSTKHQVSDLARSQQLAVVAAHLAPDDATGWRRVALISMELSYNVDAQQRTEAEASALEALNRVLKLEPRDFASAADRAALRSRLGEAHSATSELAAVLHQEEALNDVSAPKLASYLVLAESAHTAGNKNIATNALQQCLLETKAALNRLASSDAIHTKENERDTKIIRSQPNAATELQEAPVSNRDDDEDELFRLLGIHDRCRLELARLEYAAGRFAQALHILEPKNRSNPEPLDLAAQRGACLARLGRLDQAAIAWNPLVLRSRDFCRSHQTLTPEEKEEQCAEYAYLLEVCVAAAMDHWKTMSTSAQRIAFPLRTLLDGLGRVHAVWGHKDDEARAHARLATILTAAGAKLAAEKRLAQAVKANPDQPLALARRVDACHNAESLHPLLYVYRRIAEASINEEYKEDELEAWMALARAFGRELTRDDVPLAQKKRSAARVLALSMGSLAESWSGTSLARCDASELGRCAVTLAVPTGIFRSSNAPLKKTFDLDASNTVLAQRVATLASSSEVIHRADLFELVILALVILEEMPAASDLLSDALAITQCAPELAPATTTEITSIANKFELQPPNTLEEISPMDGTVSPRHSERQHLRSLVSAAAKAAVDPCGGAARLAHTMTTAAKLRYTKVSAALYSLDTALAQTAAPELAALTSAALPRTHLALDRLRLCENNDAAELSRTAALLDLAKRGAPIEPPNGAGLLQGGCSDNRHAIVIASACAFDRYSKIRSSCTDEHSSEISFNLARFLQGADLFALAEPHYRKLFDDDSKHQGEDRIPFHRLAAFNLLVGIHNQSSSDHRRLQPLFREDGPLAIHLDDDDINNNGSHE